MLRKSSSASARPPFAKASSASVVSLQQVVASLPWSHKLTLCGKDALLECSLDTLAQLNEVQLRFLHIYTILISFGSHF